jgi:hypothetical protein
MTDEVELGKLGKWADDFKTVGNALRLYLLFMLYGSEVLSGNKKSLTFGEMRHVLGYPNTNRVNSNLSYHLSALIGAGFVEKEPQQTDKGIGEIEVIYHLSSKGKNFLEDFNVVQVIQEKLGNRTK